MQNQDGFLGICEDQGIPNYVFRVFVYLCARAGFENTVHITREEIVEKLRTSGVSATRAIKTLERRGMIARLPKAGRNYWFLINPDYVWKGRVENFEKTQRAFDRLRRSFTVVETGSNAR